MSTWYDVKLATLQKMFAADATINSDESTTGYIAAMPYAANEGLQMLATAGKFITKKITIVNDPIKNLLSESLSKPIHPIEGESFSFTADGAKSAFFEVSGIGEYTITVGDVEGEPIPVESKSVFMPVRILISNPDGLSVTIKVSSDYPMVVRNIALYRATFVDESDVPFFRDKIPYDLTALCEDFYQIDPQGIFYEGDYSTYLQTSDFYQEGSKILLIDRDMVGSFTVYYRAYPVEITSATPDSYEMPVDPEVLPLLSLYMASQLYLDDDSGIATQYRNAFEVAFERLKNTANSSTKEEWVSESGWI